MDLTLVTSDYAAADRAAVYSSTDRSRPDCSLAPGPSVAAAEIQGVSAAPSQTFSGLPARIAKSYSCRFLKEENPHAMHCRWRCNFHRRKDHLASGHWRPSVGADSPVPRNGEMGRDGSRLLFATVILCASPPGRLPAFVPLGRQKVVLEVSLIRSQQFGYQAQHELSSERYLIYKKSDNLII